MKKRWLLVAESARARIYSQVVGDDSLGEVEDLTHPESRLHDRDLVSDGPGRAFDSAGQGRHAMEPGVHMHQHEAQVFARRIATHLQSACAEGAFDELVIAAPPKFLGLLREQLSPTIRSRLTNTIHKNLIRSTPAELARHLAEQA